MYTVVTVLLLAFWFTDRAPLEAYGWLAVQGVIWILLVQALRRLSTFFYFRKHHPNEMHPIKTIAAPWIALHRPARRPATCCTTTSTSWPAATSSYIEEVFTIGPLFFNWLGIIGVRPAARGAGLRVLHQAHEPGQVRDHGPLRQRGRVAERYASAT